MSFCMYLCIPFRMLYVPMNLMTRHLNWLNLCYISVFTNRQWTDNETKSLETIYS